jgi:hypothetical protein
MTSYEERIAAMGNSDSDSDYLEMKKYVKPKPAATATKKKKTRTSKVASKTAAAKTGSSGSPANKRKRASISTIKEESDAMQFEDYGLSELFATPSYTPEHTLRSSYVGYDHPTANTLHLQDTLAQGQGLENAYNNPAFSYNLVFDTNPVDGFSTEELPQVNVPASYGYSGESGHSLYDDGHNGSAGEVQQVTSTVSPSQNDPYRYEGSESEDERPHKATKLNKDGEPRKPRRPRPKLLKWSDDDWKNVILGIVWACGETGVQIPFEQAAQVVGEHCTAGALQQALLKLRGKQIAEGHQIPSLRMAWTRKNRHKSSSSSSSTNSISAQVHDAGKDGTSPRKQPTRVDGTQSKLVTLRRSYSDVDRQGIPFPYKWKQSSRRKELFMSWDSTDMRQDDAIGHSRSQSVPNTQEAPESGSSAALSINAQTPDSSKLHPYAHAPTHAIQTQSGIRSIQGRRQQSHRNGKVSFGSGELTLNPAGSVGGQTATFHDYSDSEGVFVMDPLNDVPETAPGDLSALQHSENALGLLEGRGRTDGSSELRTDFVFPERPNNLDQSSSGIPRIASTHNNAARRQGHRRSAAVFSGAFFEAGMPNSINSANVNRIDNNEGEEMITYNDIVANTTLIHAPNTPNRLAQVYSPGYLDSANSQSHQSSPSTPDNTVAAKGHVSFALTSSTRSNGAFNPQGNHTVDLNDDMTMTRASYETLLTANDPGGLNNGFADLADDIFN